MTISKCNKIFLISFLIIAVLSSIYFITTPHYIEMIVITPILYGFIFCPEAFNIGFTLGLRGINKKESIILSLSYICTLSIIGIIVLCNKSYIGESIGGVFLILLIILALITIISSIIVYYTYPQLTIVKEKIIFYILLFLILLPKWSVFLLCNSKIHYMYLGFLPDVIVKFSVMIFCMLFFGIVIGKLFDKLFKLNLPDCAKWKRIIVNIIVIILLPLAFLASIPMFVFFLFAAAASPIWPDIPVEITF